MNVRASPRRRDLPLVGAILIALGGFARSVSAAELPTFEQVKAGYRSSDTALVDRYGAPLQLVRTDMRGRRMNWTPLNQVSAAFRSALLVSEDKRFYEHAGVDWTAVGAAAWGNLWNSRTRGASTVTMQLAGLLADDWAKPKGGRSTLGKLGQAATALRLERSWRKDQILEAYLNLVSFRGKAVGIEAMSSTLFQKYPSGLDGHEAAIAAALIRAPNASAKLIGDRACGILRAQGRGKDCDFVSGVAAHLLASSLATRLDADAQLAPHFARRVLGGMKDAPAQVGTTINARLQRLVRDTLRRQISELQARHVEDGAVIVLDNASGDVLAWVGSTGSLSRAADVDGVLAKRQAGSTLKPFLYEQAIEQRLLTAASLLDDSPVGLATKAGLYVPQNYDHHFKGVVSVRTALGSSLNIPAVRTLVMVTPERFEQRLRTLGIELGRGGDFYGYSLALGSAEVTLAELTNAYRALANGGVVTPLRLRSTDARGESRRVMDEAASFVLADILSDREARVETFGLDNTLNARYWAGVKTGTSKEVVSH